MSSGDRHRLELHLDHALRVNVHEIAQSITEQGERQGMIVHTVVHGHELGVTLDGGGDKVYAFEAAIRQWWGDHVDG